MEWLRPPEARTSLLSRVLPVRPESNDFLEKAEESEGRKPQAA
jgi:hypothetical protein